MLVLFNDVVILVVTFGHVMIILRVELPKSFVKTTGGAKCCAPLSPSMVIYKS